MTKTLDACERMKWLAEELGKGTIESFDLGWRSDKERLWGSVTVRTDKELVKLEVDAKAPKKVVHPF